MFNLVYDVCRPLEATTSRRKRYVSGTSFYGTTNESIFCREPRKDTVIPWNEVRRIFVRRSMLDPVARFVIEADRRRKIEIRLQFLDDPDFVPFLNTLINRAIEHGLDIKSLTDLRKEYQPWRLHTASSSNVIRELKPLFWLWGALFLPLAVGLCSAAPFMKNAADTLRNAENLPSDPFSLMVKYYGVACLFFVAGFALTAFFGGQLVRDFRNAADARKRRKFEQIVSGLDKAAWESYHREKEKENEARVERRAADLQRIAEDRRRFGTGPRKLDRSARWAMMWGDGMADGLIALATLFGGLMLVLSFLPPNDNFPKALFPIGGVLCLSLIALSPLVLVDFRHRVRMLTDGEPLAGTVVAAEGKNVPTRFVRVRIDGRRRIVRILDKENAPGRSLLLFFHDRLDKTALAGIGVSPLPNGLEYDETTRTFSAPNFRFSAELKYCVAALAVELVAFAAVFVWRL